MSDVGWSFVKGHGTGNDFVVLDATREPLTLGAEEMRRLGDRRFGVGALAGRKGCEIR